MSDKERLLSHGKRQFRDLTKKRKRGMPKEDTDYMDDVNNQTMQAQESDEVAQEVILRIHPTLFPNIL